MYKYLVILMALGACTPDFEAEYVDPERVTLIDDKWSQADLAKVKSIAHKLQAQLSKEDMATYGSRPAILFPQIENHTDEHIDTDIIRSEITDVFSETSNFVFIDEVLREKMAREIKYQQKSGMVAEDKKVSVGKQVGTQLILACGIHKIINTSVDRKKQFITYHLELRITDLERGIVLRKAKTVMTKATKRSRVGL